MTALSADECGWRQYPSPLPGVLRFLAETPDYYAEADVAEVIAASQWDEIQNKVIDRLLDGIYGRGVVLLDA